MRNYIFVKLTIFEMFVGRKLTFHVPFEIFYNFSFHGEFSENFTVFSFKILGISDVHFRKRNEK